MTPRVPVSAQTRSAGEFYARWRPFLNERARSCVRQDEVEDLIGETFLVCLRRPEILELADDQVRGLLSVAIRHRAIDMRRRRRPDSLGQLDPTEERVPSPLGVLLNSEARERARHLWDGLFEHLDGLRAKLRSTQREALDAYLDGADDYREAALLVDLTEGQLTQRIHSAVRRLYASLDSSWRRDLAPLRKLQSSEISEALPRRRARLRLLELLARQARKQVKRDTERFVYHRVVRLSAVERSVFDRWVASERVLLDLSDADRPVAEEVVLDIAGALHSEEAHLVSLLLESLGRDVRVGRRPVGQGPGAESPLLRWCLRSLRPKLALVASRALREVTVQSAAPLPFRARSGPARAFAPSVRQPDAVHHAGRTPA